MRETTSGVRMQSHEEFGKVLVAERAFRAGDTVLAEQPLIVAELRGAGEHAKPAFQALAAAHDVNVVGLVAVETFAGAPVKLQEKLLREMCVPDLRALKASDMPSKMIKCCQRLAVAITSRTNTCKELSESKLLPKATILKVATMWFTNAHQYNDAGAIFEVGSKLAHSCKPPNTIYSVKEGLGCHNAARDIAPDELLTTDYSDALMNCQSTPCRRAHLYNIKAFRCMCERCTREVDYFRGLPCPRCNPRDGAGELPDDVAFGKKPLTGVLYCDMAKAEAEDPEPWQCNKCGGRFPDCFKDLCGRGRVGAYLGFDAEAQIEASMKLHHELYQLSESGAGLAEVDAAARDLLQKRSIRPISQEVAEMSRALGPMHGAVHRARYYETDERRAQLKELMGSRVPAMIKAGAMPRGFWAELEATVEPCLARIYENILRFWRWLDRHTPTDPAAVLKGQINAVAADLMLCGTQLLPKAARTNNSLTRLEHSCIALVHKLFRLLASSYKEGVPADLQEALSVCRELMAVPMMSDGTALEGSWPAARDPRAPLVAAAEQALRKLKGSMAAADGQQGAAGKTGIEAEEPSDINGSDASILQLAQRLPKSCSTLSAEEMKEFGNNKFRKGHWNAAVALYTVGLRNEPRNALLLANRAMALLKVSKFEEAEADCRAALDQQDAAEGPLAAKLLYRRGLALRGLGRATAAAESFERVLQLEPKNKLARDELEAARACSPS